MPANPSNTASASDTEALQNLYAIARSERSFEISQLVQRNNFVMIFQGVLFAGFIQGSASATLPALISLIISLVGFFTALAQYFMAAGAKFWQERWEIEVELIEKGLQAILTTDEQRKLWFPLFTRCTEEVENTVKQRVKGKLFGSSIAARWSPSRLPIFVALIFLLAWGGLAIAHLDINPGTGIKIVRIHSAA